MYRRDENGHAYGTLSDFDLSSLCGEPSNNKQRTGTLPFMAIKLLSASDPIVHQYEHDVESFYWVMLYAVLCAEDGLADCPMRDWGNLGMEALGKDKTHYILTSYLSAKFRPVETRRIDFRRFDGVQQAVANMVLAGAHREIRTQDLPGPWEDEFNQQPEAIPLDVDEVYNTLEEQRKWGVTRVPLDKVRPDFQGVLGAAITPSTV